MKVRVVGTLVILGVFAATAELGSYLALRYVVGQWAPQRLYTAPEVREADFERYRVLRDEVLGWPTPQQGGPQPRPVPAFPAHGGECVSLYGDSFVYADEVGDAEAWGNLLSQALRCRVANYGVPAYGTDQAYLRFRGNPGDAAPLAILGIYPYDILRNVNRYRYLLSGGEIYSLKPRFVLDAGRLVLVPLPPMGYEGFLRTLASPAEHLSHETFLPDSSEGPIRVDFPYSGALGRLLVSAPIRNRLLGRPSWTHFLDETHPSQSLQLATAIAVAFDQTARRRGKESFVLLFPTVSSFRYFHESGKSATEPLSKRLAARGVRSLDLHAALAELLGDRSYCELMTDEARCSGHYNPQGNQLVAEAVRRFIGKRKAGGLRAAAVAPPARAATQFSAPTRRADTFVAMAATSSSDGNRSRTPTTPEVPTR